LSLLIVVGKRILVLSIETWLELLLLWLRLHATHEVVVHTSSAWIGTKVITHISSKLMIIHLVLLWHTSTKAWVHTIVHTTIHSTAHLVLVHASCHIVVGHASHWYEWLIHIILLTILCCVIATIEVVKG